MAGPADYASCDLEMVLYTRYVNPSIPIDDALRKAFKLVTTFQQAVQTVLPKEHVRILAELIAEELRCRFTK